MEKQENEIRFFKENDPYGEFSNFYQTSSPILFEGKEYSTSEHIYQAAKYIYPDAPEINQVYVEIIRKINTPYKAKILANENQLYQYQWQIDLNRIIHEYQQKGIKSNPN